jgi:hypothetical protein
MRLAIASDARRSGSRTNNPLERIMREIRRRTRVVAANRRGGLCPIDFDDLPLGQLTRPLLLLRDCHGAAAPEGVPVSCHKGNLAVLILDDKTYAFLFIRHSSSPGATALMLSRQNIRD